MKIKRMQAVDRYLGQFLCFMASLIKSRRPKAAPPLTDILIIKMFGLGTIILMMPMIRALRKAHSQARISFLTFEENRDIVEMYGTCDAVYTISRKTVWRFFAGTLAAIRKLRKKHLSMVIDGEFFSRYTALLALLLKARFRSGFFSYDIYRGHFLDHRAYFNPYRHVSKSFFELVLPFIDPQADARIKAPRLPDSAINSLPAKIAPLKPGDPDQPIILLNPNVSGMSDNMDRSWPLASFVAFGEYCRLKGFQPVYIGGAQDIRRAETAVAMSLNGARSIAGKTTLIETMALMKKSFLLVTNDSGPLHMAVAMGLPTISFFGTESPFIYGYDHGLHKVFWKKMACSPCLSVFNFKRGRCDFDFRCLREITVAEVSDWFDASMTRLWADYRLRLKAGPATDAGQQP